MSARAESPITGLVKYDAMCQAIAVCSRVDEAKEIRDRARAFEVYAQQAQNTEAERKAAEIRIRAERRAGELLIEMKENGQRASTKDGASSRAGRLDKPALTDLGITRDQSSRWQELARIPTKEFEAEVSKPGPKPSTEGLLNARRAADIPKVQMDPDALWVWGRIRDFERGALARDPLTLYGGMTESMREDVSRVLPTLIPWLQKLAKGKK